MSVDVLVMIVIAVLAVAGIVWAYPRLPRPWDIVLVVIVAVICLWALLSLAGIVPRVR